MGLNVARGTNVGPLEGENSLRRPRTRSIPEQGSLSDAASTIPWFLPGLRQTKTTWKTCRMSLSSDIALIGSSSSAD